MVELKVHPAAELFPMMSHEELAELAADIKANGQQIPIVVFENQILDGRNRMAACRLVSVEPNVQVLKECKSPTTFVLSTNAIRRHLTPVQRALLASDPRVLELYAKEAADRQIEAGAAGIDQGVRGAEGGRGHSKPPSGHSDPKGVSDDVSNLPTYNSDAGRATYQSAKAVGAGHSAVKTMHSVATRAPDVVEAVRNNVIKTVADAKRVAEIKDPGTRKAVLDHMVDGKSAVQARRAVTAERISKTVPSQETGKYRIIYADPPWAYGNSMPDGTTTPADYYPPMQIDEICNMQVGPGTRVVNIAEDNAVLFLWTTSPHLEESFSVIKAWGFKYKTSFVWDKVLHNMGHYNSVRHEFLLVCTRGSCTPDVKKLFDSVITEERTEHSRKPDQIYEIIDTIYPHGARIELFSRRPRTGWKVWGNQAVEAA